MTPVDRRTVKGDLERFTEREGAVWGGFVRTHAAVTRLLDADLRQRHGLSLSSYEALLKLAWAPEARLRMSELAEQCLLTPGGVTRIVDRLVADGLVERSVPQENRRVVLVEIGEVRAGDERDAQAAWGSPSSAAMPSSRVETMVKI